MQRREDVCFGPFRLELENERLWQGTRAIGLRPKSFAVLRYLTEHPGRLVTKDEFLQAVWPGIAVSESVLVVCLSEMRRVLGDDPRAPRFVETVPRKGYRFIGAVSRPEPWASAAAADPPLRQTPERIQGELAVLTTLGPALIATRGHAAPEVEHAYMRARALCQEMGDVPHLFRVLRGLSMLYLNRAELQRVRELAEQRLGLAQQQHDPALLLGAHGALGAILYHLGEFVRARVHLEQGIRLFHTQRQPPHAVQDAATDHGVACLSHLAWVLWFLGAPGPALQRSREGIALAHELAHPFSLTQALYWGAQLHQLGQDARGAQERAEAAMAVAAAHGFAQQRAQALLLHGWALARQGRRDEGIREMREGLDGWEATGARLLRPYYLALLAEAHGQGGQTEEGQRLLSEALATAHRTGERNYEAEIYRLQGELRLAGDRGQHTAAEHCFRQALDVARCQQARSLELRAAMSLGRLWRRQGKRVRARRLLAEIYESFTEEGDEADLVEAKGLLAELS